MKPLSELWPFWGLGGSNGLSGSCCGEQSFRFSCQGFLPPSRDTGRGADSENWSTRVAPVKSSQSRPPSFHQAHIPLPGMSLIFHPELLAVRDKAGSHGRGVWQRPPTLSRDCHRRSLKNEPCHLGLRRAHNCGLMFPRSCSPFWTAALRRAQRREHGAEWGRGHVTPTRCPLVLPQLLREVSKDSHSQAGQALNGTQQMETGRPKMCHRQ